MRDIRIIARLDIKGESVINTIQLEGLRLVGKPNELAMKYFKASVDEILIIDQVASLYRRGHIADLIKEFAKSVFIPITVGGGVSSIDDARVLLRSGADKIAVNTAATRQPELISGLAAEFGSQCVVVSIPAKKISSARWEVYTDGGRERSGLDVYDWCMKAVELGAGELLVTSVDNDGTRKGFDEELMAMISNRVGVPVIASGGLGQPGHAVNLCRNSLVEGVAAADFLHMNRGTVFDLKAAVNEAGFSVRVVSS